MASARRSTKTTKAAPQRARPRATANALTLACLGLGFMGALAAGQGQMAQALKLLALAALADTLAGRAAHGWNLESEIGAELDSLASLMVWGVSAGLLAYHGGLNSWGPLGMGLATFSVVAGAWRLCKGDVQSGRSHHEGLPLPAAGALLIAAVAFQAPVWALAGIIGVSAAGQLSPLRYPRPAVPLAVALPLLVSLAAAAFGKTWGWAVPGLTALVWGIGAPLYARRARGGNHGR